MKSFVVEYFLDGFVNSPGHRETRIIKSYSDDPKTIEAVIRMEVRHDNLDEELPIIMLSDVRVLGEAGLRPT
jgi:hypothetical protein